MKVKKMNKAKIISIILVSGGLVIGLYAMHSCVKHDQRVLKMVHDARSGREIIIELIKDNLDEHKQLFNAVYTALYKKHPHVMDDALKQFPTIDALANFAFDFEKKEFEAHKPDSYFIQALVDKKIVGYMSFYVQSAGIIYIRQLAIDPCYQGMGIGKHLVQTIFTMRPDITKITLITGRANLSAIGFYTHLGFVEGPITQEWADPKSWIGLEYTRK